MPALPWQGAQWDVSQPAVPTHWTAPSPLLPACAILLATLLPQVAAAAWRLQFGEHWAAQHGGKCGDELRLAVAHLRGMLRDEDEIRWRRRSVHSLVGCGTRRCWRGVCSTRKHSQSLENSYVALQSSPLHVFTLNASNCIVQDLAQETAAISAAFRLPWAAAANWMRQRSPGAKLAPASVPGREKGESWPWSAGLLQSLQGCMIRDMHGKAGDSATLLRCRRFAGQCGSQQRDGRLRDTGDPGAPRGDGPHGAGRRASLRSHVHAYAAVGTASVLPSHKFGKGCTRFQHVLLAPCCCPSCACEVGIHMAPSRTACHSLVRCIADPGTHQRYMAAALGTRAQAPAPQAAAAHAGGTAASPGPEAEAGSLGSAAATSAGQAATSSTLQACSSSSGASGAVSPDVEPEQSLSEADQLLAEASSFGAGEAGVDW